MEEQEKEEYKALKYFLANNIQTVDYQRKRLGKRFPIKDEVDNGLCNAGYLEYGNMPISKREYQDHYLTKEGYKKLGELRKIYYDYWRQKLTIANLIMFMANIILFGVSIFLFGKGLGWW